MKVVEEGKTNHLPHVKSAQAIYSVWLLEAMEGPTPVYVIRW